MEERYCHECGSPLTQDVTFCPSCGAVIDPSAADSVPQTTAVRDTNNRKTLTVLCLVWGIGAVIIGLCLYFSAESITDEMISNLKSQIYMDNKTYWDYFLDSGFDRNLFVNAFEATGLVLVISGLMALVSAHFIYRGEHYAIALVTLILSSIFAACGIITLIVGIVVTYSLTKHKNEFVS